MKVQTINTAKLRSNSTPLENSQGNPGLLKVINLLKVMTTGSVINKFLAFLNSESITDDIWACSYLEKPPLQQSPAALAPQGLRAIWN